MWEILVAGGLLIGVGIFQILEIRKITNLIERLEGWRPEVTIVPKSEEGFELCYYCGYRFPPDQLITIGGYKYCTPHGRRTKDGDYTAG
jgi:hypothetical protein